MMSPPPPSYRSSKPVIVTAALGAAIAVAATLTGGWDEAAARAPYALLGGASFALGGLLVWLVKRRAGR